jgi:hypothetical protein
MLNGREDNLVLRVHPDANASSFVVKAGRTTSRDAHEMLWNDWAALQFLGELGLDPPLSPRLFGGDSSVPFIVMEDLGVNSIEPCALMDGTDPDRAAAALISYVKCTGQLHSATLGKSAHFQRIRRSLAEDLSQKPLYHDPWSCCEKRTPAEISQAIREYRNIFNLTSITPESGVDSEIERVTSEVEQCPEPYSVLCQGDQNGPGGCLYNVLGIRLIDFGACGFRHPLIEGMPHRLTWGCTKRIPRRLYSRLDKVYQCELSRGHKELADDRMFHAAMMAAAARWNVFHTIWRVPDALHADRPRGATSLRQQVVAWLSAFSEMSAEFSQMPSLGNSAQRLLSRLKKLWPAETHTIPYYSAFKNG